jgi:hypothetical protein
MIKKNSLIFFLYDFNFFPSLLGGRVHKSPTQLKKRLGGRRPPSKTLGWAAPSRNQPSISALDTIIESYIKTAESNSTMSALAF